MKSTNEQNRIQKDWLDSIEKRLGYEWTPNKEVSGEILPDRPRLEKPITKKRTATANSAVSNPPIHEPVKETNRVHIRKFRPYHHTF